MAIVKKNIWLIFYTFLFISIIFFTIVSYLKWQDTYHEQKLSQENHVNLIATSTHALFATHELLLDIMGRRFIEDETYKNFFILLHIPMLLTFPILKNFPKVETLS